MSDPCIFPPPAPPNGPVDWDRAVRVNCFTNIGRLGRWTGGTTGVATGADPSSHFAPVEPSSLGGGAKPPPIYVLIHGWAPTYRSVVDAAGGNLQWWDSSASVDGRWTSDWAWSPVTVPLAKTFTVNATGVLQSIAALEPDAAIVAYSWIDDSATELLDEASQSEAYTNLNGIRLAAALQLAIASSFWAGPGELRLIGHSHGSKVATVATLTLQQQGRRVSQLTICDAPESESTLELNAANLLGFYLNQMQIADPSQGAAGGTFVDNYPSWFGVGYAGAPEVARIAEVELDASPLYGPTDFGNRHSYAAAWYGGAAGGAAATRQPPLGLSWPPPPSPYRPALNQTWPEGTTERSQWQVHVGTPLHDTFAYSTKSLKVTTDSTSGNVTGDPSTKLVFSPTPGAASSFTGYYSNSLLSSGYGVALDLVWTQPHLGDYLVVAMMAPGTHHQETLLVMDGKSLPAGKQSVAMTSVATSGVFSVYMWIYFVAADGNQLGQVAISNFQLVEVASASGHLNARRQAMAAAAAEDRAVRAPAAPQPAPSAVPPAP